jgi:hypothetical protein
MTRRCRAVSSRHQSIDFDKILGNRDNRHRPEGGADDLVAPVHGIGPHEGLVVAAVLAAVSEGPVHDLHAHDAVYCALRQLPVRAQLRLPRKVVDTTRVLSHEQSEVVAVRQVLDAHAHVGVPRQR